MPPTPVKLAKPSVIPKIRINRQDTRREDCAVVVGNHESFLHASDLSLDISSRLELNRHRSFIKHIRQIPGIGETSGRFVTARKSKEKRRKRHRQVSKYFIGLSSDEEEIGVAAALIEQIEMRPCPKSPKQFLAVGRSHSFRGGELGVEKALNVS